MTPRPAALAEYAARRRKIMRALKGAAAVVFAGDSVGEDFEVDPAFRYLTGRTDEPGAVLLLDPGHPTPARREVLLLRARDPELEQWNGLRESIGASLREETGFQTIQRLGALPRLLTEAARRAKRIACLHPFATYDRPPSRDLDLYRKLAERIPGLAIEDRTDVLVKARAVKSRAEIAAIQRAADITAEGYRVVLAGLRPGLTEFDVQEMLEHAYRTNGARDTGYGTVVGCGLMATVLHYRANSATLETGDLVCIDSAARYAGYCADVTRTFPVGGRFSERQLELYRLVLRAEEAAIRAVKPGVTLAELDQVARKIIEKAGYGDAFIHFIGHHLGLEVHDVTPDGPLQAGAVVTIEPGVYLPDEKIGIRIEDDILVTKSGYRNLTRAIPKKAQDIEQQMAPAHRRGKR